MDQLGSAELKQTLIRGVIGNLSTSMGISIALESRWWIGGLVLALSYIARWLLVSLFAHLNIDRGPMTPFSMKWDSFA